MKKIQCLVFNLHCYRPYCPLLFSETFILLIFLLFFFEGNFLKYHFKIIKLLLKMKNTRIEYLIVAIQQFAHQFSCSRSTTKFEIVQRPSSKRPRPRFFIKSLSSLFCSCGFQVNLRLFCGRKGGVGWGEGEGGKGVFFGIFHLISFNFEPC